MSNARKSMLPTKEQINQGAYEIYLAQGCEDGHDLSDWVEAERELSETSESSKPLAPEKPGQLS